MAGSPAGKVLFFGTYDERSHPRVRVLRQGLGSNGFDVDVVNVPLGLSTADRVSILRRPSRLPRLLLRIAAAWWHLVVSSRRLRVQPDAVVVGYLGHVDVLLARLLFRRSRIVLDYLISGYDTALDRGIGKGARLMALRGLDRVATWAADLVLVDTDENVPTIPAANRRKACVTPVGAPSEWFDVPHRTPDSFLRVVFFGLFTPLQGTIVIAQAMAKLLASRSDIRVTFIGAGQDAAAVQAILEGLDNVHFIPWVEAEELPTLIAGHDVCLGIFGVTSKALRVVPNKAVQGAAAGCHVVTSNTPPQRRVLPASTSFVRPGDSDELTQALARLAADRERVVIDAEAARAHAAANFTPAATTADLAEALRHAAITSRSP